MARFLHYVSEHQRDWDTRVQPLTYVYNSQTHRVTGISPFSIVLLRKVQSAATPGRLTKNALDMPKNAQYRPPNQRLLERMGLMRAAVERGVVVKQIPYKNKYDRRARREAFICVGDEVFINHAQHATFNSDSAEELAHKE